MVPLIPQDVEWGKTYDAGRNRFSTTWMRQCQNKRKECFHVCMQLVLNPCTHHKFQKWWLFICTARNSLVVTTGNLLESLSIGRHPSRTKKWCEGVYTLRPNHATQLLFRAESWKGPLVFGCLNSMLENAINLLIYMVYLSTLQTSINRIWSDLIQSHLPQFVQSIYQSLRTYIPSRRPIDLFIHPHVCLSFQLHSTNLTWNCMQFLKSPNMNPPYGLEWIFFPTNSSN